jgi:hypothetical protein
MGRGVAQLRKTDLGVSGRESSVHYLVQLLFLFLQEF